MMTGMVTPFPVPFSRVQRPQVAPSPSTLTTTKTTTPPRLINNPDSGDWKLFSYNIATPIEHVNGDADRNAARWLYAQKHGVEYSDVACNRVR